MLDEVEPAPSDTATMHPLTPEMISAVREGAPARLRRRLEGDLDKILLKALAKDPVRRYRSVEQFSEDVRRHLEGMPVAAREDTYLVPSEQVRSPSSGRHRGRDPHRDRTAIQLHDDRLGISCQGARSGGGRSRR